MKHFLILLLVFTNACFSQVNLDLGLQAYYPFSGNAKDASGNNNHPVFNNAALTADRFGNPRSAYHFNGRNSYMKILNSHSLKMGKRLSISMWVRPTGFYTGKCYNNMMLMKGDQDYLKGNYSLRFSDVYTGCEKPKTTEERFFDGLAVIGTSPIVQLNKWYNVVVTYDGTRARMYVNCVLVTTNPYSENFTNSYDLYIGHTNSTEYPYWLNGDLDEIRIYNRALNKEEILEICNENTEVERPEFVKKKASKKKNIVVAKQRPPLKQPDSVNKMVPMLATNEVFFADAVSIKKPALYETEKEFLPEKRNNELLREIMVDHDSVSITLYDNGEIDGDSITLIYNDKILTTHQRLTDKPLTFTIKINKGNSRNELVMYAENLGSIPPNTALMVIMDGNKRYELNVNSTKNSNGAVTFKLRE